MVHDRREEKAQEKPPRCRVAKIERKSSHCTERKKKKSAGRDIQNDKWQKTPGEDGECSEMLKAEGKETPHILQRIRT